MATFTKTRLRAGIWQGVLTIGGGESPDIDVMHLETPIQGITIKPLQGSDYLVSVPIPTSALSDGVQSFVVQNKSDGEMLTSFAIVAGSALEDDLRAEIDLLRAELDLLKRAFRRHCVETA